MSTLPTCSVPVTGKKQSTYDMDSDTPAQEAAPVQAGWFTVCFAESYPEKPFNSFVMQRQQVKSTQNQLDDKI